MLESIWNSIIQLSAQFVIPDWSGLVNLIPIGLLALVGLWLMLTVRRFATAGPTRRGRRRMAPIPPVGVHAGAGSWAPILAAIGVFLVLMGLVFGGVGLPIGIAVLVLTLLYWGREGLADYDHLVEAEPAPPPIVHPGPPPGVHMIGPSFRPILASIGLTVVFFGLVFGGWLLAAGVIIMIIALLGWLRDARAEYLKTIDADRSGHLEPLPAPGWPKTIFAIFGILVVGALVLNLGILPPRGTTAGGGPGASGQPAGSGAPPGSGGPAGSGGPGGGPAADVTITAEGVKFTTTDVKAPGGKPFKLAFDNKDPNTPHDVDILGSDGAKVFDGSIVTGPKVEVYNVPSLPPGTYKFMCSVHSTMTGTITAG